MSGYDGGAMESEASVTGDVKRQVKEEVQQAQKAQPKKLNNKKPEMTSE